MWGCVFCKGLQKISSSLSHCPVKFLKILKFGEACGDDDEVGHGDGNDQAFRREDVKS